MGKITKELILYSTLIIIGVYFLFTGAAKAQGFFVPIIIASLLSMVMLPVDNKLRSWKVPKGLSVLISDLLIIGFCIGIFSMVGAQIDNISDNWPKYKERLIPKIERAQVFIEEQTGISAQEQEAKIIKFFNSGSGNAQSVASSVIPKVFSVGAKFLLVFVYIFFFMFYRKKFKNSILNFVPEKERDKASSILRNSSKVSQQYLFGRFILIIFLGVIYSVGLLIIGIKHALLISVIAAVLTLIPYLGNVLGVILAISMSFLTNGTMGAIIGILIVFTITQFIESYILEPYIVGHHTELNPVLTIIGVIVGGFVWGIAGTIIAIPIMGILKAVFDNVPILRPLGYIIDEKDTGSNENFFVTLKDWIVKKFDSSEENGNKT